MSSIGERSPSKIFPPDDNNSGSTTWIDHVDGILKKLPENRNHAENSYLLKKLLSIKYFQQLVKLSDP